MHKPNLALLAAALIAAGCGKAPRPRELVLFIDSSGSAQALRLPFARLTRRIAFTLPAKDKGALTVYRFDARCSELYDGRRPNSSETFQASLIEALDHEPPAGTSPALAMEALARRVQRSVHPTIGVLLTDGGIDDYRPVALAQMRRAVQRLARNDKLEKLVVCGARPGLRDELRAQLEPIGDKLAFVEPDQLLEACR